MLFWFMPFTVLGGKFTRYFTAALPVVLITAAIGIQFITHWLARMAANLFVNEKARLYVPACVSALILVASVVAAAGIMPYYRLYTNALGGGPAKAGSYFPHDEFYDGGVREAVKEIAERARPGARIASETPGLITYYSQAAGRNDLVSASLSDKEEMSKFEVGDYIIVARGRRYFTNEAVTTELQEQSAPAIRVSLGQTPAINVYRLDEASRAAINEIVN
jgi:hypothetical protein